MMTWDDSRPSRAMRLARLLRRLWWRLSGRGPTSQLAKAVADYQAARQRYVIGTERQLEGALCGGQVSSPRITRTLVYRLEGDTLLSNVGESGIRVRAQNPAAAAECIAANHGLEPRYEGAA